MGPKLKPRGVEDILRDSLLDELAPQPRPTAAPSEARVHRRGNDAVLDSGDCEIVVYGMFGDRA